MLEIVIGILSGIISAMGMGGGTILILLLVYTMQIEQHVAQASNLIFFIPTAIIAIIINRKQNLLDLKTGLIVGGTGIVGAVIGSIISKNINLFKKNITVCGHFSDFFFRKCGGADAVARYAVGKGGFRTFANSFAV